MVTADPRTSQSAPMSVIASSYMVFMIVVFLFPAAPDVTSQSMNYTVVVVGGVLALSLTYYFLPVYGGMHWFKGPVETIGDIEVVEEDTRDIIDEKENKLKDGE